MRAAFTVLLCLVSMSIAQNYEYKPDPNWRAPDSAVSRPNPLASRPEATPGGKNRFLPNSGEGPGREGTGVLKKTPPDLQLPPGNQKTNGIFFWKIPNGKPNPGMPPF